MLELITATVETHYIIKADEVTFNTKQRHLNGFEVQHCKINEGFFFAKQKILPNLLKLGLKEFRFF